MEWYNLTEEEKVNNLYSKFTIKDFWDWWSDNNKLWMEIRTQDWKFAKEVGNKFNLHYSHTGVFVNNVIHLKQVILYARTRQNIWFGIQPRKWGFNKFGKKCISGADNFIQSIKFIFVDIDRKVKEKEASNEELKQVDEVCEEIIRKFNENKLCESYLKIASGNGIQLLIKIDVPISVPNVEYVNVNNEFMFLTNEMFSKTKNVLRFTIGDGLIKYVNVFCRKHNLNNVEVDRASFRMAQVGALPFTKNYKYDGSRWRGIINIKNGINEGLSDYITTLSEGMYTNERRLFSNYVAKHLDGSVQLVPGKLRQNKLVQFLLENNLPEGERNNYLWFQLKCLLRDYKIDLNSKEFKVLHKQLEEKQGKLTLNLPSKNFIFDKNIVNTYCIHNLIPPIYNLWEDNVKNLQLIDVTKKFNSNNFASSLQLNEETDIKEDMFEFKKKFIKIYEENIVEEGLSYSTILLLKQTKINTLFNLFVGGCIKKYGIKSTEYYYNFLFDKFFNYSK